MRTVLSRILALALAVGMVVLALQFKSRNGDGPPDDGNGNDPAVLRLVCAPEMEAACDLLVEADPDVKVTIEEAGDTAAALVAAGPGAVEFDGWMVPAPWPDLVALERDAAGRSNILGPQTALARSPLVIAIWIERLPVLEAACDGSLTWKCIGEKAPGTWADIDGPKGWGPVKPAHEDPTVSASGLLTLAHATTSFFGHTDYDRSELEAEYTGWLRDLERAVRDHEAPLETMLLTGPAEVDLAGGIEAELMDAVDRSPRREQFGLVRAEPTAYAVATFAPVAGTSGAAALERLVLALGSGHLTESGWLAEPGIPTPGPAKDTGLPSATVIGALREFWEETQ